jgi:hypothetical protein
MRMPSEGASQFRKAAVGARHTAAAVAASSTTAHAITRTAAIALVGTALRQRSRMGQKRVQ